MNFKSLLFTLIAIYTTNSSKQYFTIGKSRLPWSVAKQECEKLSKPFEPVTLATIITKNEYELAIKACDIGSVSANVQGCWIGLYQPSNTDWEWVDNNPVKDSFGFNTLGKPSTITSIPWHSNEPNNSGGNENCVHLWRDQSYKYNDLNCEQPNFIIIGLCQRITLDSIKIESQLNFNEFRSIDGSNNNILNKNWGKTNTGAMRCVKPEYKDGFNSLAGDNRMNAREISNVIFKQFPENDKKFLDNRFLTQFSWLWGQFIDHDVTLMSEDSFDNDITSDIDVYIPCCDAFFDKTCQCNAKQNIQVFRSKKINGTGVPGKPRIQNNELSAWIDAGTVYGSDEERAKTLRLFKEGRMDVSYSPTSYLSTSKNDELLPLNKKQLHNEPTDEPIHFIAGDVRVNEQVSLTMIHTIFIRLHNIIAEQLFPILKTDELTYQYSKLIVTAIIQKITYQDWLPSLFGEISIRKYLGNYIKYNNNLKPNICAIFSSSAFRFGHTQLTQKIPLRDNNCRELFLKNGLFGGDIDLKDAFFKNNFVNSDTIDKMVNGFSCTLASKIDTKITDGVRDFLFKFVVDNNGNRLFTDRDLVSLNIIRGRDFGLPNWNSVREQYGLPKITKFEEISSDQILNEKLRILYDHDINNIDFYVGSLSENHTPGNSFGETITNIVLKEFKKLRDSDRFWYENYIKKGPLLNYINNIKFKDVLELTTNVKLTNLDSTNNVFRNTKAISVFAKIIQSSNEQETTQASAKKIKLSENIKDTNDNKYIIKLNKIQLIYIFTSLFVVFIIFCIIFSVFYKFKNMKNKVKYTSIRMGSEASDVTDV